MKDKMIRGDVVRIYVPSVEGRYQLSDQWDWWDSRTARVDSTKQTTYGRGNSYDTQSTIYVANDGRGGPLEGLKHVAVWINPESDDDIKSFLRAVISITDYYDIHGKYVYTVLVI